MIKSAGAYPFAMDPSRLQLVTDIFFNIEGFRADRLVTVIIGPVMAQGEVRFKATVRKGQNPNAPSLPETTFLEKDMAVLPVKIAEYLEYSPFVAPTGERTEALLHILWERLLHQRDALKALIIAELDAHFRGQRLGMEITREARARHIITDTFVKEVIENEKEQELLFRIGLKVEDQTLNDVLIMTIHPIAGEKNKGVYKVAIRNGSDRYISQFPPITFTEENLLAIPQWAASLLLHSPFIVLREAA